MIGCFMDAEEEHELEFLLSLDGYEFRFASGYRVRFAARPAPRRAPAARDQVQPHFEYSRGRAPLRIGQCAQDPSTAGIRTSTRLRSAKNGRLHVHRFYPAA